LNELAGRQAAAAAYPREQQQHEPPLKMERILMMDYAPARARSKGVISTPGCGWGQAKAAVAKALIASPLPTADGVDKLYCQLVKIHVIAAVQLAECTC
jgi:hypothetical protein